MLKIYLQLAYNNLFANHRLLTAAEQLNPGEFEAKGVSFFPSIKKTLNHNITVDWYYVDAFEGGTLGVKAWENEEPFEDATSLKHAQRAVDKRLIKFCAELKDDDLPKMVSLLRYKEPLGNVLPHLLQHQVHHRGQAHAMFSGTSVAPPQLDEFMFKADSSERVKDLAELGLVEADLPNY
ncbi:DinB family protein [Maritalea sp.]|uniref:DinB family protein n=1 Tax=Maritalea sp. TaxID=2003361 RepID=UPI003EF322D0